MPARPPLPAIVTALNLNGLGVARALGRHGVPVIGIHGDEASFELRSRYLQQRWPRGDRAEDLLTLLRAKGPSFAERPVLIPITDESVGLVADHLDELRRWFRIAMPAPDVVHELLDKERMRAVAERLGVAVPRTWHVQGRADFDKAAAETSYPCILKPTSKDEAWQAAGLRKAYVLGSRDELRDLWTRVEGTGAEVVVQQFVPGGDDEIYFTLLYCKHGGHTDAVFSGRKLRQWQPHCGGTSASEPVDVPALDDAARQFFAAVGMHGLCSLEYKRDPRDGVYYMIEPTVCRPDWQNGVADHNGVPLAWVAYCDLAELPAPAVRRPRRARRWVYWSWDTQAAAYYRRRGELGLLAWLWSIRPPVRGAVFALDDLGPWLATVGAAWRRLGQKVARWFGGGPVAEKAA
ncbi:MAG: hypothetical protein KDC48_18660 [Planctomycetes bacterium]|nr:hypothetical protein [Planctomycetota bacterium]